MARDPALVLGPLSRHGGRWLAVTAADPGVTRLGEHWQRTLDRTVERWSAEVSAPQQASLTEQVRDAVSQANLSALVHLHAPTLGVDLLTSAMRDMAAAATAAVIAEAGGQGVQLEVPPPLAAISLSSWASAAADLIASGLALGTARESMRLWRPLSQAGAVVDGLSAYFTGLTDAGLRSTIGGALSRALNLGRLNGYAQKPPDVTLQLIADERLDANTCKPCRHIDGEVLPSPEAAALAYGGAGYLYCEGRERCRGTVRGVWTPLEQPGPPRPPLQSLANLRIPGDTEPHHDQLHAPGRMA